jgi:hypothetical protein
VLSAFRELRSAMLEGDHRIGQTVVFDESDRQLSKRYFDRPISEFTKRIAQAGNATDAIILINRQFAAMRDGRRNKADHKRYVKLAAAWYAPEGTYELTVASGRPLSSFAKDAVILDKGSYGKYWSTAEEMGARAFQSWIEDRMASLGRRNDYLSAGANNRGYGEKKPYPEGEERARMNAAFDKLFDALRDEQVFEKAAGDKALMDSIFGPLAEAA